MLLILSQVCFGYHSKKYEHKHHRGLVRKSLRFLQGTHHFSYVKESFTIPNSYSLQPVSSAVEDQGACGSCWDFSLTGTLRDTYLTQGMKDPGRLSFMYLLDCAKDMDGCDGGDFDAAQHMVNRKGPPIYSFQPYTAPPVSACKKGRAAASGAAYHMLGGVMGPAFKDVAYVIGVLHKPLSTQIAADNAFEAYQDGIFDACSSTEVNHMVILSGYDCEGPCNFDEHGNLPPGKGFYLIKNSWSDQWGEKGYVRIRATDKNGVRCNAIASQAMFYDLTMSHKPHRKSDRK